MYSSLVLSGRLVLLPCATAGRLGRLTPAALQDRCEQNWGSVGFGRTTGTERGGRNGSYLTKILRELEAVPLQLSGLRINS